MTQIRISADLFRRAYACVSTEATRYYLNGVHIETSPDGGALLVSTDGHRMLCLRDAKGSVGESAIIAADKGALKACSDRQAAFVTIEDDRLTVRDDRMQPLYTQAGGCVIDGIFPDWRRVVPAFEADKPSQAGPVNQRLMTALADALSPVKTKVAVLRMWAASESDPILVTGSEPLDGFGIIMPIRFPKTFERPEWLTPKISAVEGDSVAA